jgi:phosphohistidine phosphatase
MKLFLFRHGIATDRIGGAVRTDFDRPLTDEGRHETRLVASYLKKLGLKPDLVVASPLVRAKQTAEIINEVLAGDLQISDALAPGGAASDVYKFLARFPRCDEAFLVGHEPDMGRLAGSLLWVGPEFDMTFKKAGCCRIDISSLPPTSPGALKWFLAPKLVHAMNGK